MQSNWSVSRLRNNPARKASFPDTLDFPLRGTYSPKPLPPWELSMFQWECLWTALDIECIHKAK